MGEFRALALDGPLNGEYITPQQAIDNDYTGGYWPLAGDEQEFVYYSGVTPIALYPGGEAFPEAREAFWDNYVEKEAIA